MNILKFGKFKGMELNQTPKSYQEWLLKQDWYKKPIIQKSLNAQLIGWDGYSRTGQAVYDAIFEQEKAEALKQDCKDGICTCCEGSMYFGI